ncbi:MAG: hypothetical protein HOH14_10815 [Gammaproteobacteria bacterium]|nr:hypothetical protein [Gammaproteobacteria bacterium]MBT6043970.1 hypothetical protein [Gammaproteobacteria bacterium]
MMSKSESLKSGILGGLCLMSLSLWSLSSFAQQEGWEMPRTSWGDPVIQGSWTNSTTVPLQRPAEMGTKEFYTQAEVREILNRQLNTEYAETEAGTAADVHYQFDDYGMNKTADTITANLRTSIIFDPPNGRLPEPTEGALAKLAEYTVWRNEHQWESAKTRGLSERCLIWGQEGPPMLPLGYNSTYQFMQTEDYVILELEMIHDVRIIPLDGGDPMDNSLPQWMGNSRGHWEGDTLVVETTNFSGRTFANGMRGVNLSSNTHVVERFTRVSDEQISYEFTISDPSVWKQSWSGTYPFMSIDGPMFEYACHEGNYGIENILSGKRREELDAIEAARQ